MDSTPIEVDCLQNPDTGERVLQWDIDGQPTYYSVADDLSSGQQLTDPDLDGWQPCYSETDEHQIEVDLRTVRTLTTAEQATIDEGFDAVRSIIISPGLPTRISTQVSSIDGRSGILAQAGPTSIYRSTRTTAQGFIEIDERDLANGTADETVILHEAIHLLGFFNHPVLPFGQYVDRDDLGRLVFTGPKAVSVWQDMGGTGAPPLYEPDGGNHWDEDTLREELLTPFSDGEDNILSTLTLAALTDIGYKVSISASNRFNLRNALSAEACRNCGLSAT